MALSKSFQKLMGLKDKEDFDDFTDEELESAMQELKSKGEEEPQPGYKRSPFFTKPEPQQQETQQSAGPDIIRTLTGQQTVIMIEPNNFDECPKLVDSLKGRRAVIINLEKVETETARKIFDFLSGATYALNGTAKKITNNIFIFAPENVNIAQTEERNTDFSAQRNYWNK